MVAMTTDQWKVCLFVTVTVVTKTTTGTKDAPAGKAARETLDMSHLCRSALGRAQHVDVALWPCRLGLGLSHRSLGPAPLRRK